MSGVVIDGKQVAIPGLDARSWADDPRLRLKMGEDGRRRPATVRWIRAIGLHTTLGLPFDLKASGAPRILEGAGPATSVERDTVKWWSVDARHAGAHLIVDFDGSVSCLADLRAEETYHAGPVNPYTIGVEIAQRRDGALFEDQLTAVVVLCDWLTERFRIQRQIPASYVQGIVIPRCAAGGRDVVGVYGHRDATLSRGYGDPGDAVFARLEAAGFERLHFRTGEDLDVWKLRQRYLGCDVDGIPGPDTAASIVGWQTLQHYPATGVLTPLQREEIDDAAGRMPR